MRKEERIKRNKFLRNRIIEVDVYMQKNPKLKFLNFALSAFQDDEILLKDILIRIYGGKCEFRGGTYNPYNLLTLKNKHCYLLNGAKF